jgi:hypothetical protein
VRLHALIAVCMAATFGLVTSAEAIPIHHHYTVSKPMVVPRPDRPGKKVVIEKVTKVEKYDVAPKPAPVQTAPVPYTTSSTPTTTTATTSYSSSGGYSDIPGVPASFAACVAMRESSNGAGSSNIYGILAVPGGNGTLAEQKAAFSQLYAQYGTAPWAPYDGC